MKTQATVFNYFDTLFKEFYLILHILDLHFVRSRTYEVLTLDYVTARKYADNIRLCTRSQCNVTATESFMRLFNGY